MDEPQHHYTTTQKVGHATTQGQYTAAGSTQHTAHSSSTQHEDGKSD